MCAAGQSQDHAELIQLVSVAFRGHILECVHLKRVIETVTHNAVLFGQSREIILPSINFGVVTVKKDENPLGHSV